MTVLGTKITRKRMLMLLMGLFVVGNLLSALAPTLGLMLTGRVVASLALAPSSASAPSWPPTWSPPTSGPAPSP